MNYIDYKIQFKQKALEIGKSNEDISFMLKYAKFLFNQNLPVIFNDIHLSNLLGYQDFYLYSICNNQFAYYKKYEIPKKNGGVRVLHEPFPSLKEMQNWILVYILNPSAKKNVSPVAKAYMPGVNLKDNARFHRGQKKLLSVDLVDFFGSIGFSQVYSIFRKFGYSKHVSVILSNICILDDSLPQGSPTSPMLSNLVFKYYDDKIYSFCIDHKIRYTRYADDLTFSGDFNIGKVIGLLNSLFKKTSFKLNHKKTKVVSQGRQQAVTGIVVNKKLQVPRKYRKEIRQSIYYIIKFGLSQHLIAIKWKKTEIQYIYHLLGRINFVLQINPNDDEARKYDYFMKDLLEQYY